MKKTEADHPVMGSMFGLEPTPCVKGLPLGWLQCPNILLANARSGILLLIQALRPPKTWVPSFLCRSILQAGSPPLTTWGFYEINYDLAIRERRWLGEVSPGDLIILIDYFGFPSEASIAEEGRRQGAWILEDASQALLSEKVGIQADYILLSPRKFLGIPDGGILVCNRPSLFSSHVLGRPPADWWLKALEALILRRQFDRNGGDRLWFELYQQAEAECPAGPFAMSNLTEVMLQHSFNFSEIAERRSSNYRHLLDQIGHLAIFPELPPGVVPLGFPIRNTQRDRLRTALFNQQIFPAIHWEIKGFVPPKFQESHRLAEEILTLPCDQRYGAADMERLALCVTDGLYG